MLKRLAAYAAAMLVIAFALLPLSAITHEITVVFVTAAAKGTFPSGTTYQGVPLSGLRFGTGVEIPGDTSATGEFQATLLGTSTGGQPQNIVIEGEVSSGSAGSSTATFSGTCTVDKGDGTPVSKGVPFTVTITTDAEGKGTVALKLGTTTLPTATVNDGSMTIQ
jgi:hypothetical protein